MLSKNQIREIQALQLKKFRDQKRLFITEGIKSVLEVISTRPEAIEKVFGTEDFIASHLPALRAAAIDHIAITEDELAKLSLQTKPNKVLAVCHYFGEAAVLIDLDKNFSFYLDDIRDPGNFGTIVRLADWFGVSALFCSPSSCDLYNPKVIQSSMGAFLRVKIIYKALEEVVSANKIKNVYGALLGGSDVYNERLESGLIVIGNEANGINKENLKFINKPITIPAHSSSGTESLNVAMAASILASEFYRQLFRH